MDSQTELELRNEIAILRTEVNKLYRRIERMLSRAGGNLEGPVTHESYIQLAAASAPDNPTTNNIKVYGRVVGGVLQMVAHYPDGTIDIISSN